MSGGSGSGPLVPTFHGFVHNSMDGLMLFEACLSGKLHHVPRRPHDRERNSLIKSGSIFIYEENASGIKRWTDGVAWSPSRILGNFLIYRELEKPFPPGEKKRAMKRKRSANLDDGNDQPEVKMPPTPPSPKPAPETSDPTGQDGEREIDRQLIGSLVDSYGFRPDGLVKKTMSIAINGVSHHLVSYYKVDDVKKSLLRRPIEDPRLHGLTVRPELYMKQNFRTPVEEGESYMGMDHSAYPQQGGVPYGQMIPGGYSMRPSPYMQSPGGYAMYGQPGSTGGVYAPVGASGWPSAPAGYPSGGYAPHAYGDYYRNASGTPQGSYASAAPQQPYSNTTPQPAYSTSTPQPSYSTSGAQIKHEDQPQHSMPSYSSLPAPTHQYSTPNARPSSSGYSNLAPQYQQQQQQTPMRPGSATYPPASSIHHHQQQQHHRTPTGPGASSPQNYSAPGSAHGYDAKQAAPTPVMYQ